MRGCEGDGGGGGVGERWGGQEGVLELNRGEMRWGGGVGVKVRGAQEKVEGPGFFCRDGEGGGVVVTVEDLKDAFLGARECGG